MNRINLISLFCSSLLALSAQNFSNVIGSSGIDFLNSSLDKWGSGVSFYDFNHDGWDDLAFARDNASPEIYMNNAGVFQALSLPINHFDKGKMFLWVDYDNDGDSDIFLSYKGGKNYLYRNNGNLNFSNETGNAGLFTGSAENYGAAFGDYDKDGFLDLYICRYFQQGVDSFNIQLVNNLYHNNGDGTFTNVTFQAGVSDGLKVSFLPVWFDYNNDTWPDLYVVNDRTYDGSLYQNNQDGTFTKVTAEANMELGFSNYMSASVADFNHDQYLDLFISNTAANNNDLPRLFENQGVDSFLNVYSTYLGSMDNTTWGGLWLDYDNDKMQDLYVATSFLNPTLALQKNYFYVNQYPSSFVQDSSIFISDKGTNCHAVARGDFNNDGFYDIIAYNESPDTSFLWRNSGNSNNFIKISVEGTVSNKQGVGTWIRVFAGGKQYSQYTMCGENYIGQNSQHHIFGLAQDTIVDSVHLEFLSGIIDKYYNLPVNQSYHLVEGASVLPFQISILGDNPFCEGDSVVLSAPDMVSYDWNTGDTTQHIVVNTSGVFSLSAIDSNGAQIQSAMLQVNQISLPLVSSIANDVSCNGGSDGSIYLEVMNDGQDYDVAWKNGMLGDSLSGLNGGMYYFTYSDAYACEYSDSVYVEEPFSMNVQTAISAQTDSSTGLIEILVNGGSPPYEVYIDSFMLGSNLINVDSGIYTLQVYDQYNCLYEDTIEVPFQKDTSVVSGLNTELLRFIDVIPNPIKDYIIVKNTNQLKTPLTCELMDLTGQVLFKNNYSSSTDNGNRDLKINLPENLVKGIYLFRLSTREESAYIKLLKD